MKISLEAQKQVSVLVHAAADAKKALETYVSGLRSGMGLGSNMVLDIKNMEFVEKTSK